MTGQYVEQRVGPITLRHHVKWDRVSVTFDPEQYAEEYGESYERFLTVRDLAVLAGICRAFEDRLRTTNRGKS